MTTFADVVIAKLGDQLNDALTSALDGLAEHLASRLTKHTPEEIASALASFQGSKKVKSKSDLKSIPIKGILALFDYSKTTHALLGETKEIKDKLLELNKGKKGKLVRYNAKLQFGPGWIILDKERFSEVEKMFKANNITFRKEDRKAYEKEIKAILGGKKDSEDAASSSESEDEKPKKAASKAPKAATSKAPPKTEVEPKKEDDKPAPKSKAETTLHTKANKWGNQEEPQTGVIFLQLPVGVAGRKVAVAIGTQDSDSTEKGLASVLPLDEEVQEECADKKWRTLTDEMMAALSKSDKKLYAELKKILEKEVDEEEEFGDDAVEEDDEE